MIDLFARESVTNNEVRPPLFIYCLFVCFCFRNFKVIGFTIPSITFRNTIRFRNFFFLPDAFTSSFYYWIYFLSNSCRLKVFLIFTC